MADDDTVECKNLLYQQTKKSIEESDISYRAFSVYFVAFRVPKYDHVNSRIYIKYVSTVDTYDVIRFIFFLCLLMKHSLIV